MYRTHLFNTVGNENDVDAGTTDVGGAEGPVYDLLGEVTVLPERLGSGLEGRARRLGVGHLGRFRSPAQNV